MSDKNLLSKIVRASGVGEEVFLLEVVTGLGGPPEDLS
ncbi:hypothetical protein CDSM653_00090 [Caldanaerobacter subterraneus subsp. pacificus DSM 12653]|uniref:Uncharacterized protein n=1 Tax=Caldanaerobacter subterraneus subsp. pacificus DSM 12653 TaxID=391606 RepID=A0A0F5PQG6_9THEO|nr:hypothetical protein CDSM653_00090 [Caldanaerobacter subterraneus subsp. pacificus DSM 12653]